MDAVPPLPVPVIVTCAVVAVAAQGWFWRRTLLRGAARMTVLTLRLGAIALLLWVLTGPERPVHAAGHEHQITVLRDISRSMNFPGREGTRAAEAAAITRRLQNTGTPEEPVSVFNFAAGLYHAEETIPEMETARGATLMAGALREVLAGRRQNTARHSVVLVSDGAARDAAELPKVAAAFRRHGVPVSVICTGGDVTVRNASLVTIDAERRAKPGTRVPVTVTTRQPGCDEALRVELLDAGGQVLDQGITSAAAGDASQTTVLSAVTGPDGFAGRVRISPAESELTLTDNEAPLTIHPDKTVLRVLYMEGSLRSDYGEPEPLFLPQALAETGEIEVDLLCPPVQGGVGLTFWPWKESPVQPDRSRGFPRTQEELNRYDVIICSDIPRQTFTPEQIAWTVDLVAGRGGGFVMIGGVTSFGAGYWDRTPWERMIPVDMDDTSRGSEGYFFSVVWTEEGKRHPLLAQLPLQEGEKLETILNAHPRFQGMNTVHRAKPAATVLMRREDGAGQPIMVVQPFGKGRSMAFTSDITFQWGEEHRGIWGPPAEAERASTRTERMSRASLRGDAPLRYNNSYYRRFWQRTVRWLAENSVRVKSTRFEAATPYPSWPGISPLTVYAAAADESLTARLSSALCTAQIRGMAGTRTRLRWDDAVRRFTGAIPRPAGLEEQITVDVEAIDPADKSRHQASFTLTAPATDAESAEPSARPDLLAAFAEATGGKVFQSAGEAIAWLKNRAGESESTETVRTVPAWDRAWVLAAVLALLSADWLIRRFST